MRHSRAHPPAGDGDRTDPRATTEDLYDLFEHAPIAYVTLDDDGTVRRANKLAITRLGKATRRVLGQKLASFFHDRAAVRSHFERACERGTQATCELELADDPSTGVQMTTVWMGEGRGFRSAMFDISAHWRLEQALSSAHDALEQRVAERTQLLSSALDELYASEDRLRVALRRSSLLVFNTDLDLRYTWVYTGSAGIDADLMLGKSDAELLPPADAEALMRVKRNVLRSGHAEKVEIPVSMASGRTRVYEVSIEPTRDPTGAITGLTGAALDVTTRKDAVDALERRVRASTAELLQLDHRLEAILQTASDAIVVVDDAGQIDLANPAASRLFGYPADTLYGMNIQLILTQELGDWRTGAPVELDALRADGFLTPVEVSVGELRNGAVQRALIIRDISERRRLEQKFLEIQKMEAVGRLASGIAHDFNNILMGIIGCTQIAGDMIPADSGAASFLDEIWRAAETGASIARQLLEFGRARTTSSEPHELSTLITGCREMLERLIGEDISFHVDQRAPDLWIDCDPVRIEQVLMNLVVNARDAMPDGGEVIVESAAVEQPDGSYVRLSVSDTGCGMDEQTRAYLFEPFFTTKPLGTGTGLGMTTVYGIVAQMHGQIEVASVPGTGTTIDLILPRVAPRPAANPPSEAAPELPVEPRQKTILVVEDEPLVRLTVRHYLRSAGHRVLEAGDGEEAIDISERYAGKVDLLLTDIVLPDLSGGDVARAVQTCNPSLAVLFMSAHGPAQLISTGRIEASDHLLQKPFTESQLLSAIDDLP